MVSASSQSLMVFTIEAKSIASLSELDCCGVVDSFDADVLRFFADKEALFLLFHRQSR